MHLDPELSARRIINIHALAGCILIVICIFQLVLTLCFSKKKEENNTYKQPVHPEREKSNQKNKRTRRTLQKNSRRSGSMMLLSNEVAGWWHRFVGRALIVLWSFIWMTGIMYFFAAATNRGLHIMNDEEKHYSMYDNEHENEDDQNDHEHEHSYNMHLSNGEKFKRAFVFAVAAVVGTFSIVNIFTGYFILARHRKKESRTERDYLIHKSCMTFALIFQLTLSLAKVTVMVVQLYIGPSVCPLGSKGVAACFAAAYLFQFVVITMSLFKYDKRLFQLRSVKWNIVGFLLLTISALASAIFHFVYPPSDGSCFATNSPLKD